MEDLSPPRPARRRLARALGVGVSLLGHGLGLLLLTTARIEGPVTPPDTPMVVSLVEPPPPPPPPPEPPAPPAPEKAPPAPVKAATPKAAPRKPAPAPKASPRLAKRPPPPDVERVAAAPTPQPTPAPAVYLSAAELAGAGTAESGSGDGGGGSGGGGGGGGGECNMTRRVQDALRRKPRFQADVARDHPEAVAAGRALVVWNGDWVRSGTQAGKGFTGIREVIQLEIAFAPAACKAMAVRGPVVVRLAEGENGARLALGKGAWRWSDLLFAR
ncbi:MAG: hypothetical protein J7521_13600 [Caulobacter sp.]|nr:hypothetical protein [Caulobacter sp.]